MNQTGSAIPRRVDGSELFTTSAPGVTTARLADESGVAYSDSNPLQVAPIVAGAAVAGGNPLPVSGSVTATISGTPSVAQSGNWTVRLNDESGAAYSDGNPLPECNAQIGSLY